MGNYHPLLSPRPAMEPHLAGDADKMSVSVKERATTIARVNRRGRTILGRGDPTTNPQLLATESRDPEPLAEEDGVLPDCDGRYLLDTFEPEERDVEVWVPRDHFPTAVGIAPDKQGSFVIFDYVSGRQHPHRIPACIIGEAGNWDRGPRAVVELHKPDLTYGLGSVGQQLRAATGGEKNDGQQGLHTNK